MTHINLFKLPPGNRQFYLIYYVKKLISKYKKIRFKPHQRALSIYTGGGVPRHIKKGGLRHGHNPKKGVLGTGTSRKRGVLGTGTSSKGGGGLKN